MKQVRRQGYDSMLLTDEGSRQTIQESDPFEPDDQFGCRDGCCTIF